VGNQILHTYNNAFTISPSSTRPLPPRCATDTPSSLAMPG